MCLAQPRSWLATGKAQLYNMLSTAQSKLERQNCLMKTVIAITMNLKTRGLERLNNIPKVTFVGTRLNPDLPHSREP